MIVDIIKLMLAPGLMISACGTLLLGTNGKYALVAGRIRALNEERRKYRIKKKETDLSAAEIIRIENITIQLDKLVYRIKLVRNSVVSYTLAIALFIISSLLIGLNYKYESPEINTLTLFIFLAGVIITFLGMMASTFEVLKAYSVVKNELNSDQRIPG
jgi:hypothetical protein